MEVDEDYEFKYAISIGCPEWCEVYHFDVDDKDRIYYAFDYHKWDGVMYLCANNDVDDDRLDRT